MLGVIIPTLCLILFGFVAYRVYKSMYRTEGRGDTDEDESFFPENDNGNGKSEDVIDVRFYRWKKGPMKEPNKKRLYYQDVFLLYKNFLNYTFLS